MRSRQPNPRFSGVEEAMSFFHGKKAILATLHGKEQVIAPVFKEELGMLVEPSDRINTDKFGTFAGDVERPLPQVETAQLKAKTCLDLHPETDFALASEGAFYSHPDSPFLTVNTEAVLLLERKTGLKVIGYHQSLDNISSSNTIASVAELYDFAAAVGFPSFGIILKSSDKGRLVVRKDFSKLVDLEVGFLELHQKYGKVTAETDLRAHRNPARMEKIQKATKDLVRRLLSLCPNCGNPDFVVKDFEKGLPCELCQTPTQLPLKDIMHCKFCNHRQEQYFIKGKTAPAGYCEWCNP